MNRGYLHQLDLDFGQFALNAALEFKSRLLSKSDGQDVGKFHQVRLHEIGHSSGNDFGFPGAGTSYDEQSIALVKYCFALGNCKTRKDVVYISHFN